MAKRKKHSAISGHKRRRRRSISGVGNIGNILIDVLAAAGGGALGGLLNKVIPDTLDKRIAAGGKLIIAAILPNLAKGKMAGPAKAASHGLAGVAAVEMLGAFGVIGLSGMGALDEDSTLVVALDGMDDLQVDELSGNDDLDELSENVLAGGDDVTTVSENVLAGDDVDVVSDGEDELAY